MWNIVKSRMVFKLKKALKIIIKLNHKKYSYFHEDQNQFKLVVANIPIEIYV